MGVVCAMDVNVKTLTPDECVPLLENGQLNVQYVPVEVGRTFKSIVEPVDQGTIAMVIAVVADASKKVDITSAGAGDDGDDKMDTSSALRYQITKNEKTHRYVLVFEFPRGAGITMEDIILLDRLLPTRIITRESEPIITASKARGFRLVITVHPHFLYAHARALTLLYNDTKLVSPGSNQELQRHEGRGVKRIRENDD